MGPGAKGQGGGDSRHRMTRRTTSDSSLGHASCHLCPEWFRGLGKVRYSMKSPTVQPPRNLYSGRVFADAVTSRRDGYAAHVLARRKPRTHSRSIYMMLTIRIFLYFVRTTTKKSSIYNHDLPASLNVLQPLQPFVHVTQGAYEIELCLPLPYQAG